MIDHWTDHHERCARRPSCPAVVPEACWAWPSGMLRAWSSERKAASWGGHRRESSPSSPGPTIELISRPTCALSRSSTAATGGGPSHPQNARDAFAIARTITA